MRKRSCCTTKTTEVNVSRLSPSAVCKLLKAKKRQDVEELSIYCNIEVAWGQKERRKVIAAIVAMKQVKSMSLYGVWRLLPAITRLMKNRKDVYCNLKVVCLTFLKFTRNTAGILLRALNYNENIEELRIFDCTCTKPTGFSIAELSSSNLRNLYLTGISNVAAICFSRSMKHQQNFHRNSSLHLNMTRSALDRFKVQRAHLKYQLLALEHSSAIDSYTIGMLSHGGQRNNRGRGEKFTSAEIKYIRSVLVKYGWG